MKRGSGYSFPMLLFLFIVVVVVLLSGEKRRLAVWDNSRVLIFDTGNWYGSSQAAAWAISL